MKKYIFTIAILFICITNVFAVEGISLKFEIFQIDKSTDSKHLTYVDSVEIEVGKTITGFVGPFSLDIEVLSADTLYTRFNTHVITLGTSAKTYSKRFSVEYELPAKIEQIEGKLSTEYLLVLTPLAYNPAIEISCEFDHLSKGDFSVKPTAYTEIYYVTSTLSDFYWDSIKELMESNYRIYKSFLNLTLPSKIHIYVPPCPINSVIWDKRFGTSVDPTRSSAFAIYNKEFITVDPFVVTHTATLRTFGYTSPFLSEGLANYFSFAIFDMKKILNENKQFPLASILETYAYYDAEASIADKMSSTFTRYLIDSYTLATLLELYKKTDDINLATTLQETYGKSVTELEKEWLVYVDTLTIFPQTYMAFSNSAEMMMNYDLMHTYNQAFLETAETRNDSLRAFASLKRSAFFVGNYYQAVEYQKMLLPLLPKKVLSDLMAMGSYSLMIGEDDQALSYYTEALALDSADQVTKFNLAIYYKNKGNAKKAKEILLSSIAEINGAGTQGETKILLADILAESDLKSDQDLAKLYFQETVNLYSQLLKSNNSSPTVYMWLGKSYFGVGDIENAINHLLIARFIESRPFYLGLIDLWIGKAYMAVGDKKLAEEYFISVVTSASAVYHQDEAKILIEQLKK